MLTLGFVIQEVSDTCISLNPPGKGIIIRFECHVRKFNIQVHLGLGTFKVVGIFFDGDGKHHEAQMCCKMSVEAIAVVQSNTLGAKIDGDSVFMLLSGSTNGVIVNS